MQSSMGKGLINLAGVLVSPRGCWILLDETPRALSVLHGTEQFVMDGLSNMLALGSREEEKKE